MQFIKTFLGLVLNLKTAAYTQQYLSVSKNSKYFLFCHIWPSARQESFPWHVCFFHTCRFFWSKSPRDGVSIKLLVPIPIMGFLNISWNTVWSLTQYSLHPIYFYVSKKILVPRTSVHELFTTFEFKKWQKLLIEKLYVIIISQSGQLSWMVECSSTN